MLVKIVFCILQLICKGFFFFLILLIINPHTFFRILLLRTIDIKVNFVCSRFQLQSGVLSEKSVSLTCLNHVVNNSYACVKDMPSTSSTSCKKKYARTHTHIFDTLSLVVGLVQSIKRQVWLVSSLARAAHWKQLTILRLLKRHKQNNINQIKRYMCKRKESHVIAVCMCFTHLACHPQTARVQVKRPTAPGTARAPALGTRSSPSFCAPNPSLSHSLTPSCPGHRDSLCTAPASHI